MSAERPLPHDQGSWAGRITVGRNFDLLRTAWSRFFDQPERRGLLSALLLAL